MDTDSESGWIGTDDFDQARFDAVVKWLDLLPGSNIHSIVVARHDTVVFEHYRDGDDRRWGTELPNASHGPECLHDLRSATKSIVGLLFGIACTRGLIPDLDVPVFDYFPDYSELRAPGKERIFVRHLLTMSAGLAWDENVPVSDPNHGEMRMWRSSDTIRTALEADLVEEPGTHWNYSGGSSELLGSILRRVTGKPLDGFARTEMFDPLGIADVEWLRHADGNASASGGLRMRSRDLAKIGQLVIGNGVWQGVQIVARHWIKESIKPQIGASDRLYFYGYHWWLGRSLVNHRPVAWASAIGLGGQRLFVVPAFGLSVVVTAGHYADTMQGWLPLALLNRFILPVVDCADPATVRHRDWTQ